MVCATRPGSAERQPGKTTTLMVPFGRRISDGRMCLPLDVPAGKACDCTCPGCDRPLVAKHCLGNRVQPHFAHFPGSDCANGYVTALHAAAAQLILDRNSLFVPVCEAVSSLRDLDGQELTRRKRLVPDQLLNLVYAEAEKTVEDIRPDILAETAVGLLNIEIAVTHFVDPEKLAKLERLKLATVEIGLSDLGRADFQILESILFQPNDRIRWLYHPGIADFQQEVSASLASALDIRNASISRRRDEEELHYQQQKATERRLREKEQRDAALAQKARKAAEAPALARAHRFRALAEDQKLAKLERFLAPNPLPHFLLDKIRGARSFGVRDPIVWVAALVGILVSNTVSQGRPALTVDFASQWLFQRFKLTPEFKNSAKVAIWDCLSALAAAQVCQHSFRGSFSIRVANYQSLLNLFAFQQQFPSALDITRAEDGWEWVPLSDWPDTTVTPALTQGWYPDYEWQRVATLLPIVRESPLSRVLRHYQHVADAKRLLAYWVGAGFVRIRKPDTRSDSPPEKAAAESGFQPANTTHVA